MAKRIQLREMTEEEEKILKRLSASQKAEVALVRRAKMILRYYAGASSVQIGRELQVDNETVGRWIHRFVRSGLDGLRDQPRSGRPAIYSVNEVSLVLQTALTDPKMLSLPFGSWTLDRLVSYLNEEKGIGIKRSRVDEILLKEGLRWRQQERWFGVRVDPDFAKKRGPLSNCTRGRRPRASSSVSMN
jgi:transposase